MNKVNFPPNSVGAVIPGKVVDLSTIVTLESAQIARFLTPADPEAKMLLQHTAAHVLGEAVLKFCPDAKLVFGPPLQDGFFYDVKFPDGMRLSSDDLPELERIMKKIIAEDRRMTRYELSVEDGLAKLKAEGSKYKVHNAELAIEQGAASLSWYVTGEPGRHFEDLCRGPHLPGTGLIAECMLTSIAASNWQGDKNSDQVTRIYGVAFFTVPDSEKYISQLEQAKRRDHRVLGRKHKLFHIDNMVGPGLVLWKPNGAVIRQQLENFISGHLVRQGYQRVFTPHIGKLDLYKTSGHFPYYQDSQFPPMVDGDQLKKMAADGCTCSQLANSMKLGEIDGYLLKPMNCPHHIAIYKSEPRSYRDLPVRLAEFGTVYRFEQSGELGGMTRVRGFTQDDAHLFVTEDQINDEVQKCIDLVKVVFKAVGMTEFRVRVGLRDPASDKYVGDPANWEKAEEACRKAAIGLGVSFTEEVGEAAFYGPKIDFVVNDCIGREWQLGTVQIDYNLPERFQLEYVGADNRVHRPVMIHRAPFGSMERFVGVLIEHFAGAFPLWLAPEQVRVLTVSDRSVEFANRVIQRLADSGLRVASNLRSERLGSKIRDAQTDLIPYMIVIGNRNEEEGTVSVRSRSEGDLGEYAVEGFIKRAMGEIQNRQ